MAGRAIDVEAFASTLEIRAGDRERELVCFHAVHLTCVEQLVRAQLPARDGSFHRLALGAAVSEEIRWLVWQILSAGCACPSGSRREASPPRQGTQRRAAPRSSCGPLSCSAVYRRYAVQSSTSNTPCGFKLSKKAFVCTRSNFLSRALMQRKKAVGRRERETRHIEQRVIRRGQAIHGQHAENRGQSSAENRQLKRDRNP